MVDKGIETLLLYYHLQFSRVLHETFSTVYCKKLHTDSCPYVRESKL